MTLGNLFATCFIEQGEKVANADDLAGNAFQILVARGKI